MRFLKVRYFERAAVLLLFTFYTSYWYFSREDDLSNENQPKHKAVRYLYNMFIEYIALAKQADNAIN